MSYNPAVSQLSLTDAAAALTPLMALMALKPLREPLKVVKAKATLKKMKATLCICLSDRKILAERVYYIIISLFCPD